MMTAEINEPRSWEMYSRSSSPSSSPTCFFSSTCFGGSSPVSDSAETPSPRPGLRRRSWWSRLLGKKKTVPVDVDGDKSPESSKPELTGEMMQKRSKRKSLSCMLFLKGKCSKVNNHYRVQREPSVTHSVPDRAQTKTIESCRSSLEPRHRSASISSPSDSSLIHKEPSTSSDENSLNSESINIAVIVVMVLTSLLLMSRFGATFFLCAILYLLRYFKRASTEETAADQAGIGRTKDKGMIEMDRSSEEYKKKIVLSGLLERDGRPHCKI